MNVPLDYPSSSAPTARRSWFTRAITENNPCYLLSAACMLLGLMTLTNSLSFSPIPHRRLIMLIGTLNLYEAVLIALAIWLFAKRRIIRDAEILLAIEALFIADGAMLSSEIFTASLGIGLIVNLILLVLSIGKLSFVAGAMQLPLLRTVAPLAGLQFLVLALPGFCKWAAEAPFFGSSGGRLPPLVLYSLWWTTSLVPVLVSLVARSVQDAFAPARRVAITFATLGAIAILVHLALASWIYKVAWYPAYSAPVVLGLAVAMMHRSRFAKPDRNAIRAQYILCALALLTVLATPDELVTGVRFPFTPLRFTLIGIAIVFAHAFYKTRFSRFAILSLGSLFIATMGSTVGVLVDRFTWPWRTVSVNGPKLIPQTSAGWGAIAVVGAFVFLAAGAVISVFKSPPEGKEVMRKA